MSTYTSGKSSCFFKAVNTGQETFYFNKNFSPTSVDSNPNQDKNQAINKWGKLSMNTKAENMK